MALFKIWFVGDNGKQTYEACNAQNGDSARQWFHDNWPTDKILRVENVTANDTAYKVANNVLAFAKASSDPRVREIAVFKKPITAVAVILAEQYKHILENDHIDDIPHMAKKAFHLMLK